MRACGKRTMRLVELQARMQRALLDGGSPAELLALFADPADQRECRLAVHRNNVRHALTSVLEAAFPVVQQLISAECFTATALAFLAVHPPRQPTLYAYGEALPTFLAGFKPLTKLPWLADVARLEWARNEALFAAEQEPLAAEELAAVPAGDLPGLRLTLHPSARLLESAWPIHTIWAAHQPDGDPLETVNLEQGEIARIWRREGSVCQQAISPGEFTLLTAFAAGQPLAEAAGSALAQDPGLNLPAILAALLSSGVLVRGLAGKNKPCCSH